MPKKPVETFQYDELPDYERAVAQVKRDQLAEHGIELTPNEYVDKLGEVLNKAVEFFDSDLGTVIQVLKSEVLPDPDPKTGCYDGLFDNLAEAEAFAARANEQDKGVRAIKCGQHWKVGK
jgi:hypothetical protein